MQPAQLVINQEVGLFVATTVPTNSPFVAGTPAVSAIVVIAGALAFAKVCEQTSANANAIKR